MTARHCTTCTCFAGHPFVPGFQRQDYIPWNRIRWLMFYGQGIPIAEIADEHGVMESTIRDQIASIDAAIATQVARKGHGPKDGSPFGGIRGNSVLFDGRSMFMVEVR